MMIIEGLKIEHFNNHFSIIEMTQSQYNSLPDYSIAFPQERAIGDMGKMPDLALPGERMVDIKENDEGGRIMSCRIIRQGRR